MRIPKQENLVSYWPGFLNEDGELHDVVGGNHGILVNTPNAISTPYGSGFGLSGGTSNDHISVPTSSVDMTTPHTISLLMRRKDTGTGTVLNFGIDSNNYLMVQYHNGQGYRIRYVVSGSVIKNRATNVFPRPLNIWEHLVLHIGSTESNVFLYINNQYVSLGLNVGINTSSANAYAIGCHNGGSANEINADMCHMLCWQSLLNSNEVTQLYNAMQRLTARRL